MCDEMMKISLSNFVQTSPYEWKITEDIHPGMKVPVVFFATKEMIMQALNDRSIEQAVNAATLPGVIDKVCVMPDMHQGYGFPIGGVAATSTEYGVISPGAIGYDINCGVRLLASSLPAASIIPYLDELSQRINALCPSGVGKG